MHVTSWAPAKVCDDVVVRSDNVVDRHKCLISRAFDWKTITNQTSQTDVHSNYHSIYGSNVWVLWYVVWIL